MMPQSQLVSFIQHSDVCAVPYVRGPARGDALKTYEYLACGKSVILTADQVTSELKPFVRYATDAQTFAQLCRELCAKDKEFVNEVSQVLKGMTWDQRAARCLDLIRGGETHDYD